MAMKEDIGLTVILSFGWFIRVGLVGARHVGVVGFLRDEFITCPNQII